MSVAPSPRLVIVGGRSVTIQCVQVPRGASGSSTIRARLSAPPGTPLHRSGGDRSSPSLAYLSGIAPPSENAGDVNRMVDSRSRMMVRDARWLEGTARYAAALQGLTCR